MKFIDLKVQYESIRKEINKAVQNVINTGCFIGGSEVESLEKEIAEFCGVKYAIGVNSGTDALFLSLKALEISPGDEVITTPFTFIATAEVVAALGAKLVFADIEPRSFNINSSKIKEKITKKTKAIVPVHLFGQIADMDEIMRIAKKYKLSVVEDAAQAIGAEYKGRKAGSIGDLSCFSFFPTKNLGAFGDGGMIIGNNKKIEAKLRLLRNHGSAPKEKYKNLILGTNSRLDAIQAAILRIKLKHLKKWNRKRVENAHYYNKFLKGVVNVTTPIINPNRTHIFHQYTIRAKRRDELQRYLKKEGIPAMIYYFLPLHLQPAFKYLGCRKNDFPEAEKAAKEVLSLPIYSGLTRENQDLIINKINKFYKEEK